MPALVAEVTDWLQSQVDKELLISKQEGDDLDELRIMLHSVERRAARPDGLDDYTNGEALLLHGTGTVLTEGREAVLPLDTFEIPLEGLRLTETADDAALVVTERARYKLEVKH